MIAKAFNLHYLFKPHAIVICIPSRQLG